MTPADLDALEKLASEATPGPWTLDRIDADSLMVMHPVGEHGVDWVFLAHRCESCAGTERKCHMPKEADALFIAAAREAVPALIAEVRRLDLFLWKARMDLHGEFCYGGSFLACACSEQLRVPAGVCRGCGSLPYHEGFLHDSDCPAEDGSSEPNP